MRRVGAGLLLSLIILLPGCRFFPLGGRQVTFTFTSSTHGSINRSIQHSVFSSGDSTSLLDDSFLREGLQEANRGERIMQLSPIDFVIDLDEMSVYTDSGSRDPLVIINTRTGAIIPKHYSLLYSKHILRDFTLLRKTYDGFTLTFLPFAGAHTSNDGYYAQSFLVVDLGSNYSGIQLAGETSYDQFPFELDPTLHYFSLSEIIPFDVSFFESIIIGDDIEEPFYSEVSFRGSGFFIPGPAIDLSGFQNPEIIFHLDTENLIEVYDAGTPGDYSDDQVTLKLSDPFPVSLRVEEATNLGAGPDENDTTPCSEVKYLDIAGPTTANTLIWINPTDQDFDRVAIVRKAGSAPVDSNDGEVVYDSYIPNYLDKDGTPGAHYYYRVMTVDFSGNFSDGIVVDQVQAGG